MKPNGEYVIEEHSCGAMNVECVCCKALYYEEEAKHAGRREHFKGNRFVGYSYALCCRHGEIKLKMWPEPPSALKQLWVGQNAEARWFRKNAKAFNHNFALASTAIKEPQNRPNSGVKYVACHGQVCHYMGSLLPKANERAQFSQLYMFDCSKDEEKARSKICLPESPHKIAVIKKNREAVRQTKSPLVKGLVLAMKKAKKNHFVKMVIKSNLKKKAI